MWGRQVLQSCLILLLTSYDAAEQHWLQNATVNRLEDSKDGEIIRNMLVKFQEQDEQGFMDLSETVEKYGCCKLVLDKIKFSGKPIDSNGLQDIQDAVEEHGYL